MLDCFEIVTSSGVVLWSRKDDGLSSSFINSLIRDVFIEDRGQAITGPTPASAARNAPYRKDQYTLKWTVAKDFGLIFVAVYQSLVHLSWIDKLLDDIRIIFLGLYADQLKTPHASSIDCRNFDPYFDELMRKLEGTSQTLEFEVTAEPSEAAPDSGNTEYAAPPVPGLLTPQNTAHRSISAPTDISPSVTPDTSRPSTPSESVITGSGGPKASRRIRKAAAAQSAANQSSGDEAKKRPKNVKSSSKKMRKWDAEGMADEADDAVLDYSTQSALTKDGSTANELQIDSSFEDLRPESFGTRTAKGDFILKDLNEEVEALLKNANEKTVESKSSAGVMSASLGVISGLFRNIVGGKVLTKEDIEKPLKGMQEHLVNKNVAQEAAIRLCEGIEKELVGVRTASFESVEAAIRTAMTTSLQKMLTPTTSLDLLRTINSITNPSTTDVLAPHPRPYVISIVGVNGVGKSTNLSKLAFFLLQNNYNILIAACDTFRSGAVEQLRVHVRNLKELASREGRGSVEIFEKGYGKDAANIAKDAVSHATTHKIDVVLIDTAGRRHNDQRLMSSLEKFAQFAMPDKIFMVGEALVGSDSVAQAQNFNAAFGGKRGLDGFIISKCDTVGDMVGSLVSMVHATGIPVVFLGVGQHYGDLRTLNVNWAVDLLMR